MFGSDTALAGVWPLQDIRADAILDQVICNFSGPKLSPIMIKAEVDAEEGTATGRVQANINIERLGMDC